MENIKLIKTVVTMPSRTVLEGMFKDTSLPQYSSTEEIEKFYNLAEKEVQVEVLFSILKGFYDNFRFLQLTSNIPKRLQFMNMGKCISMEYAYLTKALFASVPGYWYTIKEELIDEVRAQGVKDFTFLNVEEKFYGSLIITDPKIKK